MLVLSLTEGIVFQLPNGEQIDMKIAHVGSQRVSVAIEMPDDVIAVRRELVEEAVQ
jgi:sRNA-binding carbon storage regulator CsrA